MPPVPGALFRSLQSYQIYGANTNVGKTVVSTVLCKAIDQQATSKKVGFLKPVSTGPLDEADDKHIERFVPGILNSCLYRFDEPVSPHIAAAQKTIPRDAEILSSIHGTLSTWSNKGLSHAFIETAGGVHSPGPNGNSQADLYRPLRLPVILVADSRLGGISSTVSAFESLLIRGYDVNGVLLFRDGYYKNHEYLKDFFQKHGIALLALDEPPQRPSTEDPESRRRDQDAMSEYYRASANDMSVQHLLTEFSDRHRKRIEALESMNNRAYDVVWYPFTQHQGMTAKDLLTIDSAYGDYFQTTEVGRDTGNANASVLRPTFDGSASWWTQGLGHGNPDLSLTAAYAAGRYGHVMFASAIHEPALNLAELLVKNSGNPRLSKVFYTDNGSTGMEVAIKMGLRASCSRYGWDAQREEIGIIGLKGSYHGDTIGVMDCSEPSTFNSKVEWYRGRGHWFDFPQVKMVNGTWRVEIPEQLQSELGDDLEFESLDSVFDLDRRKHSETGKRYDEYLKSSISDLVHRQGRKIGAVILEPVILGAGGMLFADPLFQQALVRTVRSSSKVFDSSFNSSQTSPTSWTGLPVIFDEVFTGLYRLGRFTAGSFLDVHPDVVVNAKLLTGGLVPLCTTMASIDIFKAFESPEKSDALLHGHSYTAHAVGCKVAETSVKTMMAMEKNGHWKESQADWSSSSDSGNVQEGNASQKSQVWSSWSHSLVRDLSLADSVESTFALGSVLCIVLRDEAGGGYSSNAAKTLQQKLRTTKTSFNVHSRVLGNVLYLMASMKSRSDELRDIETALRSSLL